MLHQMQQGAKPFKRPKVTKPSMSSTFEQELHNILGVANAGKTQDTEEQEEGERELNKNEPSKNTRMKGRNHIESGGVQETVTSGAFLRAVAVDSELGKFFLEQQANPPLLKNVSGIDINEEKIEVMQSSSFLLNGSGIENLFFTTGVSYVGIASKLKDPSRPAQIPLTLHGISNKYSDNYISKFSQLGTIFDSGGDVNQYIRVFTILFLDWCMSIIILLPHLRDNANKDPLLETVAKSSTFAKVCFDSPDKDSLQKTLGEKIVDLVSFISLINYMSLYATKTEDEADPVQRDEMLQRSESFQSKAEKDFQSRLLEITEEYTGNIIELKAGLKRLIDFIPPGGGDVPLKFDKEKEEIITAIREVGIEPITKSKQQLDIIAQLKKDLAGKTLEIKKLTKQLGNGTGGGVAYLSQGMTGSNSLSKEEQLLNKKTFDLLLPLKIREVFMKYPAYRYGLTLAGKIHLRNEQSIFVTDITQLVYIQHESNPLSSTIPKIDESYVKIQVEQARTRYLSFLHSTPVTDIVAECMQLLTPTMVSVLQTCLNETKKLVELETNRRITAEELLCPKGGNTAHEGLYDKFTSWVAAVYISDQQIQKNIATTQSDKNAQNLSRLKTILDLRQGLIDMGYRVKPNPYSMA